MVGQQQTPPASGEGWVCLDFPGQSAWMPTSLSTGHVTTARAFTSPKRGLFLCETEANVEVREFSIQEPLAQKHSGHHGCIPVGHQCSIPLPPPPPCPWALPRPHP